MLGSIDILGPGNSLSDFLMDTSMQGKLLIAIGCRLAEKHNQLLSLFRGAIARTKAFEEMEIFKSVPLDPFSVQE